MRAQLLQVNCRRRIGTTDNVNTPFTCRPCWQNTEVNVTDPKHPLFGRQFSVVSFYKHGTHGDCAIVKYHQGITLRIPITATDLGFIPVASPTKLSSLALENLLSLAQECQLICQPPINRISGNSCLQRNSKPSPEI